MHLLLLFFFLLHLLPLHCVPCCFPSLCLLPLIPHHIHACSMSCDHHVVVVLMSLLLILLQCDYALLSCVMHVTGRYNSLIEVPSIVAPPPVSPSLSPTLPPEPQTQIEKESQRKGEWTPSTACIEVHTAGLRRSSEPLPCSLPQPYAEPPSEAVNHLTVTSEQRS